MDFFFLAPFNFQSLNSEIVSALKTTHNESSFYSNKKKSHHQPLGGKTRSPSPWQST